MDGIRFARRSDVPRLVAPAKTRRLPPPGFQFGGDDSDRASREILHLRRNEESGERSLRGRETRRGGRRASSWNERLTSPRRKSDWVLPPIRRTCPEIPQDGCFETPACVPTWPRSVARNSRGTSRVCGTSRTPCGPPSAGRGPGLPLRIVRCPRGFLPR